MTALPATEIAEVTALTLEGRGVLRPAGKRVLVPGALAGEEVAYQRRRRRRNYDEGVLVEVRRASPDRVPPGCEYFGKCGGCSLQHLSPDAQLAMKQATLIDSFARIADLTPAEVLPPVRGAVWGYRRKARLGVRHVEKKGRVLVGFRERGSSFVADMATCHVLVAQVARLIEPLGRLIGGLTLSRRLPQVEVAAGDRGAILVLRTLDPPTTGDRAALRAFAADHGVTLCLQPGDEATIIGLDGAPPPDLTYALPEYDLEFAFGPTDFVQVNGPLNRRLVAAAMALLDPQPDATVLDLFCGLGNFTLPLARHAGRVIGLEGSAALVARAAANAARNGIGNATFAVRDLYRGDPGPLVPAGTRVDQVLLDPPRTGAGRALPALAALGARRIAYVSCNPATLAGDAAELVRHHGYRLQAAGAVDMFPHTAHAEALALFGK